MAAIPHVAFTPDAVTITAGGTRYVYLGNGPDAVSSNTTEAPVAIPYRTAGTFSKLGINVTTNDRTGAGTFKLRKNTADGNQTMSITATTTGFFQDTSNSDTIAAGDTVDGSITSGTGGTTFIANGWGALFAATTNTASRYVVSWGGAVLTDTQLIGIAGARSTSATEASQIGRAFVTGTVRHWAARIASNSRDGTTTLASRVNAANGNGAVSITASSTGTFEDTSNSDTIAVTDEFCMRATLAGTSGTITMAWAALDFQTTDVSFQHAAEASGNISFGLTRYATVAGAPAAWSATESAHQFPALLTATVSVLTTYVATNSVNGTSTLTLRKATADAALAVSITASTTGRFSDTTNTESVTNLDLLAVKLVTGGSSGSLALAQHSLHWGDASAGASSGQPASKRMAWVPFGAHGKLPRASVWGV